MKAIQYRHFGGPEVLELTEIAEPVPGPGEVRVALRAASVIPGDCKLRAGLLQAHFKVTFPKIPGRDGAGIVTAVGPDVTYTRVGDEVCVVAQHTESGTCAQAIVRDASTVIAKPASLGFEEAAAVTHAGCCAWIMLVETAHVQRGMKVLVHAGAGAIGSLTVQLAAHLGAEVAATCRAANLDYVRGLGAHRVIAYDRDDFTRHVRDYDVVLDLIGGAVHDRSYGVLRRGGHIVYLIAEPFRDRSAEFGVRVTRAAIHDTPQIMRAVIDLAAAGIVRPQICDALPLAAAADAHRRLEAGQVSRGRIVLRIPA
jgi:NADPH:quinone reductase-like Zn-dependent oxidoreductase